MELSKSNEGIKNLITTGLDTYFGVKYNLPPVMTVLSQVSDVSLMVFEAQQQFRESKFYKFFNRVKPTAQEKENLYDKLGDAKEEFLRALLIKLENVDHEYKAVLIGTMYNTLFKEPQATDLFRRLVTVVEKTYIDDLRSFIFLSQDKGRLTTVLGDPKFRIDKTLINSLLSAGLITENAKSAMGSPSISYTISSLGDYFYDFATNFGVENLETSMVA